MLTILFSCFLFFCLIIVFSIVITLLGNKDLVSLLFFVYGYCNRVCLGLIALPLGSFGSDSF